MAVPGILGDYIVKNYKRLLICVVPQSPSEDDVQDYAEQTLPDNLEPAEQPDHMERAEQGEHTEPARRRRLSISRVARRSSRMPSTPVGAAEVARSLSDEEPFVCVRDGQRMVREDPFRGCVSSRSFMHGPRRSGDFVLLGCMQV